MSNIERKISDLKYCVETTLGDVNYLHKKINEIMMYVDDLVNDLKEDI